MALAWVIRRPNVVAIPGASSVAQLEANVAAADLELSDDDDARLTDESDRFDPTRGVAAVPGLLAARLGRATTQGDQGGSRDRPRSVLAARAWISVRRVAPTWSRASRAATAASSMRAEQPAMDTGGAASSAMRVARAAKASAAGPVPRTTGTPASPPAATDDSMGMRPSSGTPASWARASPPPWPNSGYSWPCSQRKLLMFSTTPTIRM